MIDKKSKYIIKLYWSKSKKITFVSLYERKKRYNQFIYRYTANSEAQKQEAISLLNSIYNLNNDYIVTQEADTF